MADFQDHLDKFYQRQAIVIGASVDSEADARKTIGRYNLTFPLAYGLNAREFSAITGAYFHAEHEHLHATGFIIGPDNRVVNAVYSTGPIGRLSAIDCLGLIDYPDRKRFPW